MTSQEAYLNDSVGNFRTGDDGVSGHHTIGVFFTDLRDQKGTHTSTGTSTKGVGDLESYRYILSLALHINIVA